MPHDVISTCPVCSNELTITRLHCRNCGTALEGEFGVGRFGRLTREQLSLLESFLRARGNLKEMERELGISYPTVRGRIDALVRGLGLGGPAASPDEAEPTDEEEFSAETSDPASRRRQILERLARRELSAEDAAAELRALGSQA